MKKFYFQKWILFVVFFCTISPFSYPSENNYIQGTVEFFLGNYNMDESRFKAVYGKEVAIKGIAFSASVFRFINIYFEAKYFKKDGELTYTKEKTTLQLLPVSLGIRFIKKFGLFYPFIGAGGDLYFYHEDNPIGTVLNYTRGYHFQGGVYIQPIKKIPLLFGARLKYTRAETQEK